MSQLEHRHGATGTLCPRRTAPFKTATLPPNDDFERWRDCWTWPAQAYRSPATLAEDDLLCADWDSRRWEGVTSVTPSKWLPTTLASQQGSG